ncbi:MAG: CrcB family protein [Acidimicrobiaceae bacterium]|nr:CrcB family protein [Acidimicrobiaceae bacterium]
MSASRFVATAGLAIAGIVGAVLRWAVTEIVDDPLTTLLVVNSVGAFILGMLLRTHAENSSIQLFLGIGFCGSLTTFSTLAVEIAERIDRGQIADAIGFTAVTVGVGLVAVLSGHRLGTQLAGRPA